MVQETSTDNAETLSVIFNPRAILRTVAPGAANVFAELATSGDRAAQSAFWDHDLQQAMTFVETYVGSAGLGEDKKAQRLNHAAAMLRVPGVVADLAHADMGERVLDLTASFKASEQRAAVLSSDGAFAALVYNDLGDDVLNMAIMLNESEQITKILTAPGVCASMITNGHEYLLGRTLGIMNTELETSEQRARVLKTEGMVESLVENDYGQQAMRMIENLETSEQRAAVLATKDVAANLVYSGFGEQVLTQTIALETPQQRLSVLQDHNTLAAFKIKGLSGLVERVVTTALRELPPDEAAAYEPRTNATNAGNQPAAAPVGPAGNSPEP
jgi:hypothetical protein